MTVFMHFNKPQITYSFDPDTIHCQCGNCGKYLKVEADPFEENDGCEVYKAWCENCGSVRVVWEEDEDCPEYGGDTGE